MSSVHGLNRIVRIVKNQESGYRHLDSFADMIYLTVGELDIPAHDSQSISYTVTDVMKRYDTAL